nr:MAG TPA: hypothetical protein [Caudoviricetes sp.]
MLLAFLSPSFLWYIFTSSKFILFKNIIYAYILFYSLK